MFHILRVVILRVDCTVLGSFLFVCFCCFGESVRYVPVGGLVVFFFGCLLVVVLFSAVTWLARAIAGWLWDDCVVASVGMHSFLLLSARDTCSGVFAAF